MRSMTALTSVRARIDRIELAWLAIAFSAAQMADLVTATRVAHEVNPIAASVAADPLVGVALKTGLVAFVIATADIVGRRRPTLARLVLIVGALAGLVGAVSNTHLMPIVIG